LGKKKGRVCSRFQERNLTQQGEKNIQTLRRSLQGEKGGQFGGGTRQKKRGCGRTLANKEREGRNEQTLKFLEERTGGD